MRFRGSSSKFRANTCIHGPRGVQPSFWPLFFFLSLLVQASSSSSLHRTAKGLFVRRRLAIRPAVVASPERRAIQCPGRCLLSASRASPASLFVRQRAGASCKPLCAHLLESLAVPFCCVCVKCSSTGWPLGSILGLNARLSPLLQGYIPQRHLSLCTTRDPARNRDSQKCLRLHSSFSRCFSCRPLPQRPSARPREPSASARSLAARREAV
jgi:hypothetical protein